MLVVPSLFFHVSMTQNTSSHATFIIQYIDQRATSMTQNNHLMIIKVKNVSLNLSSLTFSYLWSISTLTSVKEALENHHWINAMT